MRRSKGSPWYQDLRHRMRFERGSSAVFPTLSGNCTGRSLSALVTYRVTVPVPEYEARQVTILFENHIEPLLTSVEADGPTQSPHRYTTRRLCMWYPSDPPHLRWVSEDGLLALLGTTQEHLFREAYWRETGRWIGPQAPHGDGPKEDKS